MVTVACCWWGWYPPYYVTRLRDAIAANLALKHRFVCLTDRSEIPDGIGTLQLRGRMLPGNLKLASLYHPDSGLRGRVVAFDLDSIITGSLDDICSYDGPFCVAGDFNTGEPDGFLRSFVAEDATWLWKQAWTSARDEITREIPYLRHELKQPDLWQNVVPRQVVSYKRHCAKYQRIPDNARIVSCHGKPKNEDVPEWLKQHWIRN